MKEMFHFCQVILAGLGGWLGWFLGGWDGTVLLLIAFITIDYLTGVMCAIDNRSLSSEIGYKGIFRKCFMLMIVGMGAMIDSKILKTGEVLRTAIIFYYISNEGISILENATRLGVPFPEKLTVVLEQLKDEGGDDDEI